MPVNGRRSDAGAADVVALGAAIGLPEAASRWVLRTAVERAGGWLRMLDATWINRPATAADGLLTASHKTSRAALLAHPAAQSLGD